MTQNILTDLNQTQSQTARSPTSLEEMLGWNSVGVFFAGEHYDNETLHTNRDTSLIALSDPYPEFKQFVLLDGDYHHTTTLLKTNYEEVFDEFFNTHGKAKVLPLAAVSHIERSDHGIPCWVSNNPDQR